MLCITSWLEKHVYWFSSTLLSFSASVSEYLCPFGKLSKKGCLWTQNEWVSWVTCLHYRLLRSSPVGETSNISTLQAFGDPYWLHVGSLCFRFVDLLNMAAVSSEGRFRIAFVLSCRGPFLVTTHNNNFFSWSDFLSFHCLTNNAKQCAPCI